MTKLLDLLGDIRRRQGELVRLALLALVTLPLWPVIAVLAATRRGRGFLMRCLSRLGNLDLLVWDILQRLHIIPPPQNMAPPCEPLLFSPPPADDSTTEPAVQLMRYQCPQHRYLLERIGYPLTTARADEIEPIKRLSFSRAQSRMLRISIAPGSPAETKS